MCVELSEQLLHNYEIGHLPECIFLITFESDAMADMQTDSAVRRCHFG